MPVICRSSADDGGRHRRHSRGSMRRLESTRKKRHAPAYCAASVAYAAPDAEKVERRAERASHQDDAQRRLRVLLPEAPALRAGGEERGGNGEGADAQVRRRGGDEVRGAPHDAQHVRGEEVQAEAHGASEREREERGVGERAPDRLAVAVRARARHHAGGGDGEERKQLEHDLEHRGVRAERGEARAPVPPHGGGVDEAHQRVRQKRAQRGNREGRHLAQLLAPEHAEKRVGGVFRETFSRKSFFSRRAGSFSRRRSREPRRRAGVAAGARRGRQRAARGVAIVRSASHVVRVAGGKIRSAFEILLFRRRARAQARLCLVEVGVAAVQHGGGHLRADGGHVQHAVAVASAPRVHVLSRAGGPLVGHRVGAQRADRIFAIGRARLPGARAARFRGRVFARGVVRARSRARLRGARRDARAAVGRVPGSADARVVRPARVVR